MSDVDSKSGDVFDDTLDQTGEPDSQNPGSSGPADPLLQDAGEQQFGSQDTPSPAEGADGGEALEGDISQLLEQAESQRDEYLDLARRAQADFENYRKRSARDVADARSRGAAEAVSELLPVVDNLERALQSVAHEEGAQADERLASLANGVRLVLDEFINRLKRLGIEPIEPAGERFDPNLHEALTTMPREGVEAGVVLEVAAKGYRLGETVVRPAKVVVSS